MPLKAVPEPVDEVPGRTARASTAQGCEPAVDGLGELGEGPFPGLARGAGAGHAAHPAATVGGVAHGFGTG
ncbi:hypothetical protein ACFQ7B_08745 [Streptomyces erythrochromogenes]|uniref:hypothetical protein n=1 Tax=Streptomyces erythrochromogenes TaxID=285574 RepID=UPI00367DFA9A